jgi:hypothetical protein
MVEVIMRSALIALSLGCVGVLAQPVLADDLVSVNQAIVTAGASLTNLSASALAAAAANGNISMINQVGSNNFAETDQLGSQNLASIGQFGNGNSLTITKDAIGAIAIENQFGNGNQLTVTQIGVHPQPVVITQRR